MEGCIDAAIRNKKLFTIIHGDVIQEVFIPVNPQVRKIHEKNKGTDSAFPLFLPFKFFLKRENNVHCLTSGWFCLKIHE